MGKMQNSGEKARSSPAWLCAKAFGVCVVGSGIVALVMASAHAMFAARWLGFAVGLLVCAAAMALFCKAWGAAPHMGAVVVWYMLRVVVVFGAVAAAVFVPSLDAVGVLIPQLFALPALAALVALNDR
jgi:uncharacterized membrane protein HdeD (DUF308 family)